MFRTAMAESQSSYESLKSEVLDLKIDNLQKQKEILSLQRRISELETGSAVSEHVQPSMQVAHISSHGKVHLNVCDSADPVVDSRDSSPRPSKDKRENKVVKIETKRHASSFHFEKRDEWIGKLKSEVANLPDEMRRRNCLATAVRQNCIEITNNIPMQDGSFLDQLFSSSCLDEEEVKKVSQSRRNETNQLRAVIVTVLKKDFSTVLALVSCIRESNKALGEKIVKSYNALVSSGDGVEEKCWVCSLKDRVKFEAFVDSLMSEGLIDDEVYEEASREDLSTYERQRVWREVFKQLTSHGKNLQIMKCLRDAVNNSGVHQDIVTLISQKIDGDRCFLHCECGPKMQELKVSDYEGDASKDSGNNTFMYSADDGALMGEASQTRKGERSSGFSDS